jgi:hypothetical protein
MKTEKSIKRKFISLILIFTLYLEEDKNKFYS